MKPIDIDKAVQTIREGIESSDARGDDAYAAVQKQKAATLAAVDLLGSIAKDLRLLTQQRR